MISERPSASVALRLPSVVIVGAGNVGWVLGCALQGAGVPIVAVYNRGKERAQELSERLGCSAYSGEAYPLEEADVYLVAVRDEECEAVCARFAREDVVVAHTSGATPCPQLQGLMGGVFYPFQTFTRGRELDMHEVPIFVEGTCDEAVSTLKMLAGAISDRVYELGTESRRWLHLLGVLSSNFVNHLLAVSARIASEQGLTMDWVWPLVEETVRKGERLGPREAQTGPARRGDSVTMARHLSLLGNRYPEYTSLYTDMSARIVAMYGVHNQEETKQ